MKDRRIKDKPMKYIAYVIGRGGGATFKLTDSLEEAREFANQHGGNIYTRADDSWYQGLVAGIREAGMTQLPALLSEVVEASVKAGCFKNNEALKRFVSRRISEIEEKK